MILFFCIHRHFLPVSKNVILSTYFDSITFRLGGQRDNYFILVGGTLACNGFATLVCDRLASIACSLSRASPYV